MSPAAKQEKRPTRLLRLPQVLERIPMSKSSWWAGVKAGKYPQPVKPSPGVSAWRESDIDALIESFSGDKA